MNYKNPLPRKAMIVEDEQDLCFLLSFVLLQKNLIPCCSTTIAEAKKSIQQIKPAVMFLDNCLPDGSGIDFISEIKDKLPFTKIVMISAHNSYEEMKTAKKEGADYFISTPFTTDIIRNTIDLLIPQTSI